jgi:hypothetical protein
MAFYCSCFFLLPCIVEAIMHHGAYYELGGAALRTVHSAMLFLLGDLLCVHCMERVGGGNGVFGGVV